MARRKRFTPGQVVEVRREPGSAWEPATYGKVANTAGHHWVDLPEGAPGIYVDSMSGMHYDEADVEGRRYLTRTIVVPSIRVRAASASSGPSGDQGPAMDAGTIQAIEDLRAFVVAHGETAFADLCTAALRREEWALGRIYPALYYWHAGLHPSLRHTLDQNGDLARLIRATDTTRRARRRGPALPDPEP